MQLPLMFVVVAVTSSIVVDSSPVIVVAASPPCLPDEQEFYGTDPKHQGSSYFAVNFKEGKLAIKRTDGSRMIKIYTPGGKSKRYDVKGSKCTFQSIPGTMDMPQCVPVTAKDNGQAWMFKNIDGATLFYSKHSPSAILKKTSPDGKTTVTFNSWKPTVQHPDVFTIPTNCKPAKRHYMSY